MGQAEGLADAPTKQKEEEMKQFWGVMDWPLSPSWKCIVCGKRRLLWGILHAHCCCQTCHTEYDMRDYSQPGNRVVDTPITSLKDEFLQPAKLAWANWHKPLDELSLEQWAKVGAPLAEEERC